MQHSCWFPLFVFLIKFKTFFFFLPQNLNNKNLMMFQVYISYYYALGWLCPHLTPLRIQKVNDSYIIFISEFLLTKYIYSLNIYYDLVYNIREVDTTFWFQATLAWTNSTFPILIHSLSFSTRCQTIIGDYFGCVVKVRTHGAET